LGLGRIPSFFLQLYLPYLLLSEGQLGFLPPTTDRLPSGLWFTLLSTEQINTHSHPPKKTKTAHVYTLTCYQPGAAVDWLNSQTWGGNLLLALLPTKFKSPGKELMEQICMLASYAQVTTYVTNKQFLDQCMAETIALPQVASETLPFLPMESDLKKSLREKPS